MLAQLISKINENRNVGIIGLALVVVCLTGILWRRIGTPEKIENTITNKYDQSHNQWQSTLVFPDKNIPFEYGSIVYELPLGSPAERAQRIKSDLDPKCAIWFTAAQVSHEVYVIGCFYVRNKR